MKPGSWQAECDRCAWAEAAGYLALTYEELAKLEQAFRVGEERSPRWVNCCGQEALVDVHIGKIGLFRTRITVEVILSGGGEDSERCTSIVYFERLRSGGLKGPWGPSPIPIEYERKRRTHRGDQDQHDQ